MSGVRIWPAGFFIVMLLLAGTVKLLALGEFAPLYHTLLFLPAKLAAVLSGESYAAVGGIYSFRSFVLDYSCAGVNFLLLCLVAAAWQGRMHATSAVTFVASLLGVTCTAWCATNIANSFRIGLSLRLMHLTARHEWLHEAVGTIVFIVFLIAYYQLLLRFRHESTRQVS